jgi:hypothetical protein
MSDAEDQQFDLRYRQLLAMAEAELELMSAACTLQTRADFVRFMEAIRQHLADFMPAFDITVRLTDYLAAVIRVVDTCFDDPDQSTLWQGSEAPDARAWSLLGTVLASAYFQADASAPANAAPEPDEPEGQGLQIRGGLRVYRKSALPHSKGALND